MSLAEARRDQLNLFAAKVVFREPDPSLLVKSLAWDKVSEATLPRKYRAKDFARMTSANLYLAIAKLSKRYPTLVPECLLLSCWEVKDCGLGSYVATWSVSPRTLELAEVSAHPNCCYGDYPGEAGLRSLISVLGLEEKLFNATTSWLLKQKKV